MAFRYAVYYAPPPGSAVGALGASWLGRSAEGESATGAVPIPPAVGGLDPVWWRDATAEPRRYGFHATLKPPFRLAPGLGEDDLTGAVATLAAATARFEIPGIVLRRLSGFMALVPAAPCPALGALAAECVTVLDRFRAAAPPEELARRRRAGLSPRQEGYLAAWGYPYVLEEFRFHMTLTGRLGDAEAVRAAALLGPLAAPLERAPLPVADLALFEEPEEGAPFRLRRRFPLAPAPTAR